jgi:hypothetical protein
VNVPQLRGSVTGFPQRRPKFDIRSSHVEFVMAKVALGWISSEYFGFSYQFSFLQLFRIY